MNKERLKEILAEVERDLETAYQAHSENVIADRFKWYAALASMITVRRDLQARIDAINLQSIMTHTNMGEPKE
jgi:hypothetical protein